MRTDPDFKRLYDYGDPRRAPLVLCNVHARGAGLRYVGGCDQALPCSFLSRGGCGLLPEDSGRSGG